MLPTMLLCIRSILLLCLLPFVQLADPLYTIAAPNSFRPNAPYQIIFTNHESPGPIDVTAELKDSSDNKPKQLIVKEKVKVGQTELITLSVGNWGQGDYVLTINGTGGIVFSKKSRVNFNGKTFSTFIQTDKAIYKPGQVVHFRIIQTDVQLKPHDEKNSSIYITDSQGNRVKQWDNVNFENGVYEESLKLADHVILGNWQIQYIAKNDQTVIRDVAIQEYVLPTFEVIVTPPPFATVNDSVIIVTVEAKYTYGKPVKGKVLLNVTTNYYYGKHFAVSTSIDGKADIKVNLIDDLDVDRKYFYQQSFDLSAVVTEEETGRQEKGTGQITMYNTNYKLSFTNQGNFKPGLKYTTILQVSLQDDSPVINGGKVSVNYYANEQFSTNPTQVLNYTIPNDGTIEIDVTPPESAENIRFEANFKGASASEYVSKAQSLSDRYLQISLLYQKPKVGDTIKLRIDSTNNLDQPIILLVIGRGRILQFKDIKSNNKKSLEISLTLSSEMAPKVRVIVYYATPCREVVADAIDFSVDGIFKTKVEIEAKPETVDPGAPVDVSIATSPGAYVGVLAVDQSVLLLKSGNDLTLKVVLDDLLLYEAGYQPIYKIYNYDYYIRPWRPPSSSTMQLFTECGFIFFSNGLFVQQPSYHPRPLYGGHRAGMMNLVMDDAPMAAEGFVLKGSAPNALVEPTRVRTNFLETFLWVDKIAGKDGKASINATAPDSITSYIITAFAMDESNGLGLTKSSAKLRVFRPFFIVINLPYSIVRGEILAFQAIIFNYLDKEVKAKVTLDNDNGSLKFQDTEGKVSGNTLTKTVDVKSGDGTTVIFLVSAKKVGYIDIKVTARSTAAADAISRKLLVNAEGKPVYFNKAALIDLRNQASSQDKITIDIPKNAIKDSEEIEVSAIADVMGSTIINLAQLLQMPYGCGEQNMLNFVPDIVITDYLTKTKQLTNEIKTTALQYMEEGYQRELTFKRFDSSFSAFGDQDKNGSIWLTAFVIKSFVQASQFITIDNNVIKSSLTWLAENQAETGSFTETGEVIHNKEMAGGSGKGLALTAYVLATFLESKKIEIDGVSIQTVIKKSQTLLESQLPNIKSDYELVLTTYVLHLANSPKKNDAFNRMNQRAKRDKDYTFWSSPLPDVNKSTIYYERPRSVDVEMTAYALLTYVLRGLTSEGVPIMRWLISKRNANGGFASTQDTVVGIQALAQFAAMLTPPDHFKVEIVVSYLQDSKTITLTKETALIIHREELPNNVREVDIKATGNGVGVVQVSWSYNILSENKFPAFEVHVSASGGKDNLNVSVCTKYIYKQNGESNMAVLEIALPSGYVADLRQLPSTDYEKKIKKVETKNLDTVVVIYFDNINKEVCTEVKGFRVFQMEKIVPALVQVYDYYDPAKSGEQFYTLPSQSGK